jgi:hypothetical protein
MSVGSVRVAGSRDSSAVQGGRRSVSEWTSRSVMPVGSVSPAGCGGSLAVRGGRGSVPGRTSRSPVQVGSVEADGRRDSLVGGVAERHRAGRALRGGGTVVLPGGSVEVRGSWPGSRPDRFAGRRQHRLAVVRTAGRVGVGAAGGRVGAIDRPAAVRTGGCDVIVPGGCQGGASDWLGGHREGLA